MKFYNRENELALLERIRELTAQSAQMTFVTGRRRIGKTILLTKASEGRDFIYFFVGKKNEVLLCSEFTEEIRKSLGVSLYGEIRNFRDLFAFLMDLSQTRHFTLIIDEFQEFTSINPAVYSDMQHLWDQAKHGSRINLVLCGSVYSMMTRIFEHAKEPLFGRATQRLAVKPFSIDTLKEILRDYYPGYSPDDLLAFYLFTGGVAKYVELLVNASAFTFDRMLDELLSENSLFLEEGRNVLIEEFGKDYGNYFSILSLIASGKTARSELESVMEMQTGGFLDRLENEYGIIRKVRPVLAKPGSRSVKYRIHDNFLSFWFRFTYKYRSAVEMRNLTFLKQIVRRDYTTYSGMILEKYFTEKLVSEKKYNLVGTYWERGNQNEIDIVAVNDFEKKVMFAEVKRKKENISMEVLKQKSASLQQQQFQGYIVEYAGFSMEDM